MMWSAFYIWVLRHLQKAKAPVQLGVALAGEGIIVVTTPEGRVFKIEVTQVEGPE